MSVISSGAAAFAAEYASDAHRVFGVADAKVVLAKGVLLVIDELCKVTLRSYTSLLEVAEQRSGDILLLGVLETYLNGCITIILYGLDLSHYTRTAFDYCARHILAVGTENGSHSDFLS